MNLWQMRYFVQICLLERSSRGVRPTQHGEILLDKCKKIINEYDEMVESLEQEIQRDNKTICIGVASILYTDLLKSVLFAFQEDNPDVMFKFIELGSYSCERYLKDNLVDLCIALRPNNANEYRYIPLCETGLVLLLSKKIHLVKEKGLE